MLSWYMAVKDEVEAMRDDDRSETVDSCCTAGALVTRTSGKHNISQGMP